MVPLLGTEDTATPHIAELPQTQLERSLWEPSPHEAHCSFPNHLLSVQTGQPENKTFSQRGSSCTAILRPGSKVPTSSVPKGQSRGCSELPCKALQGQETREVLLTQGVNNQERMQVPRMDIVGLGGAEQSASG